MRTKNHSKGPRIAGTVFLVIGMLSVIFGFGFVEGNFRLYIADEIVGAVCILAGMTPWIRYFQDQAERKKDQASGSETDNGRVPQEAGQSDARSGFRPSSGWVMADVTGITRNLRSSENDQVEYYVLCRYYDGVSHTYQTFTSSALKNYPGKDIIGKRVKVIFHSSDPDDYTVDLESVQG